MEDYYGMSIEMNRVMMLHGFRFNHTKGGINILRIVIQGYGRFYKGVYWSNHQTRNLY